jgi:DUF1680 family protein
MLAFLRERAGLPPKAKPYGGWDGAGRQLTGHIAGHYLSAVSYMYLATGDDRFKQRADYIVSELKAVQDARGNGYIGALLGNAESEPGAERKSPSQLIDAESLFEQVAKGSIRSGGFDLNGMWSPWYVEHKLFAGLRDAYRMTGNKTALEVETKFAAWAQTIVGNLTDAQDQKMLGTEFGGMNEVCVDLYADTGDAQWLGLADKFHHRAMIDPLAKGEDVLGGTHANTQVPKFIGAAAEYVYTARQPAGDAARHFWDAVVDHHSFATGGHGYDEYFGAPDQLSGQVDGTGQRSQDLRASESCNVYNMLKLTRMLFALKPQVRYADYQERALFNHVLGSINPANGRMCYMVPVGPGVVHEYQSMFNDFTCCVGTGMENHALLSDGIYYASPDGSRLWVNTYAPSTAKWDAAGAELTVETPFPSPGETKLKIALKQPKQFTLSLRRPAWALDGFAISINGQRLTDLGKCDSFVDIARTWADGDTITIVLPGSLRIEPLPDNPARVAIFYGPLLLAGDYGPQTTGGQAENASANPVDFPVFAHANEPLSEWLVPVEDSPLTFRATTAQGQELKLAPFYTVHDRRYAVYWDLFSTQQWAQQQATYVAQQAKQKRLAAATAAFFQIGQMQPERDFNFKSRGSKTVRVDGQPGRRGGQWISFETAVKADVPMALIITTTDLEAKDALSALDVTVNDEKVGQPSRDPSDESKFVDLLFPIPASAGRGKERATFRIAAPAGAQLPAIYSLRIMRTD